MRTTVRRIAMIVLACAMPAVAALPMLRADGTHFADAAVRPVLLRGCNLGNYLMLEGWMFGGTLHKDGPGFRDGATVYRTLRDRFGDPQAARLIELYRDSWITPRDFALIKSFGFNVVRLPFDYRLIQDDVPPFAIRPDAFRWLDHAVDLAEAAGLYTILDLHGAPGGQSNADHTGESGQDHLWSIVEDQQRTVAVWRALAEHFKKRTGVAAYDLINEPYGNHHEDVRPVLATLMPDVTRAIRATGDAHVVFFPGVINKDGIAFYGNPHDAGLTNVAFTEHYYPGLFGSKPALETQARTLNVGFPAKQAAMTQIGCPYFVGEFNVVMASENAPRVMRAYYDRFAEYGWAGTMWSYKLLSAAGGVGANGWYAVTNAGPLAKLDLDTASYAELETFLRNLATMPLAVNEPLRDALTRPDPGPLFLAKHPTQATTQPSAVTADAGPSLLSPGFTSDWARTGEGFAAGDDDTITLDLAQPAGQLVREAKVTAGSRYVFTIDATSVTAAAVELRLESKTGDGTWTVNFQKFDLAPATPGRLSLTGTAATDTLRLIVTAPVKAAAGTGLVTFRNARLKVIDDSN